MVVVLVFSVAVAHVVALLLWSVRRTYRPEGSGHDVNGSARRTRLRAQERSSRWGAGL